MDDMKKKALEKLQYLENVRKKQELLGDDYSKELADMAFIGAAEIFETMFGESVVRVNGIVKLSKEAL